MQTICTHLLRGVRAVHVILVTQFLDDGLGLLVWHQGRMLLDPATHWRAGPCLGNLQHRHIRIIGWKNVNKLLFYIFRQCRTSVLNSSTQYRNLIYNLTTSVSNPPIACLIVSCQCYLRTDLYQIYLLIKLTDLCIWMGTHTSVPLLSDKSSGFFGRVLRKKKPPAWQRLCRELRH